MNSKIKIILIALISMMLACNSVAIGNMTQNESNSNEIKQSAFITPVDLYSTLAGLQGVIKGNPGTFLMEYQNLVMFSWPDKYCYSFAVFTKNGKPILDMMESIGLNGQKVDVFTMSSFVKFLENKGWTYIQPNQLPIAMLTALQSYAITAVSTASKALVSMPILIIPGTFYQVPTPKVVKQ